MTAKSFLWSKKGKEFLNREYNKSSRSTYSIAQELKTYPNMIRRALIHHGYELKSKSEAQAAALQSGRHDHPTKGRKRTVEERLNISKGVARSWSELSDEERERRVEIAREQWAKTPPAEKRRMMDAAHDALRKAAREGSKLEHLVVTGLQVEGYEAHLHGKCLISNEQMEVDIYLPNEKIAIEIDGPSHYYPMWGEERLQKTQKADKEKNGHLVMGGYSIVRLKHLTKTLSAHYKRTVLKQLIELIDEIVKDSTPKVYFLDVDDA